MSGDLFLAGITRTFRKQRVFTRGVSQAVTKVWDQCGSGVLNSMWVTADI